MILVIRPLDTICSHVIIEVDDMLKIFMCCNREIVLKNSTGAWLKYCLTRAYPCGTSTDLCHTASPDSLSNLFKLLSNYMMHILVMRPFMLPKGIWQIRFRDTCAGATNFFNNTRSILKVVPAERCLK